MAEQTILFNRDVRPILSDRCFHCHGPNEHDRQANLRLDQAEGPEGAHRTLDGSQAIKPGSIADSEVWYRLTTEDDDRMPPPDSSKKPLTAGEKRVIKRWIEEGAAYADFWAFVPPRRPAVPEVENRRWSRQPIDRFVLRRLKAEGLAPNSTADRRTLIRRLSFDLTGLPPTREEIRTFLADASTDSCECLVDRLLAKPQYGEHMTKYWLDLVRFADTNGIHHDHYREMTPYRDWVIRAFNQNLPYDEFVKYQLAGDLYPEPTRDQLIASGFHRLHLIIDRGTALPEESFTRNVVDRLTTVGTAFMGMTVQCAACHDHKYDPITTKDFYQLFAFFNNLDGEPETGGRQGTDFVRGLQPPYISLATEAQEARLRELDRRIDEAKARIEKIELLASEAGDETGKKTPDAELKQANEVLEKIQAEKRAFEATIPMAMVMKEKADRRPAHILIRGAYDNPGERVERDTPAFLPPMTTKDGLKTRMDLAEWFVSPEHPLTARVAVNRFWQQLFGVGIVKTAEDFGAQGEWPSHPDLLDYLAVSFIESGWDVKALMKQIVISETYQQASEAKPERFEDDPENRLLSRGSRFRMDSEMIRDQVLATSGLLNDELYGKSVKPPQPAGLWETVSMPSSYPRIYEPDTGDKIYRRSVYTFWKRGMPPPQMTILNAPSREACIARRERTNTPLQALLLMNEPEYLKAARHLA
ncbi:MAG: PSD1 and planctomycete cytochrome C domain-containing protein, partial [Rhodothermia bacterium]